MEDIQCIWGTWVISEVWEERCCIEDDEIGTYHKIIEDMEIMEQYELIEEWRETGST